MAKKGLIGLAAGCLLVAGGLTLTFLKGEGEDDKEAVKSLSPIHFRTAIKPSGKLEVTISRHDSSIGRLADMNDRGDLLFLTSKRGAKITEYLHEYQGKEVEHRRIEKQITLKLGPDGLLIPTNIDAVVDRNPALFPFTDDAGQPITCSNYSLLVVRRKHNEKSGKDQYGLDLDYQPKISARSVDENRIGSYYGSVKNVVSLTKNDTKKDITQHFPYPDIENGINIYEGSSAIVFPKSKELYQAKDPITILDSFDTSTIWLIERHVTKTADTGRLLRLSNGIAKEIRSAEGYTGLRRLVATDSVVAATFVEAVSKDLIRSYLRKGDQWSELPIPNGFEFSFVQKVFDDGTILGYVTPGYSGAANSEVSKDSIRQVIWKDDACIILNDLPGWPKQGLYSQIILANRKGDIYVRNILNPQTGQSEYYLLNVSVKR